MMNLKKQILQKLDTEHYRDHVFPKTRRDFLRMGFLGGIGAMTSMNTLQLLLGSKAQAQDITSPGVPVLIFDLAGGAGLPGNFLVGGPGGAEDLLPDYSQLGWNPRASNLDKTYGLPMGGGISQILTGFNQTIPQGDRKNFQIGSYLNFSRDDTGENVLSALGLLTKAQKGGLFLKSGLGQILRSSGGNSATSDLLDQNRPLFLNSFMVLQNLTKMSVENASSRKAIQILTEEIGDKESVVRGALGELNYLLEKGSEPLDPRAYPELSAIYQLSNRNIESPEFLEASIVINTILGNVGSSVITIGGCDYHDGSRQTGDSKDLQIGRSIGRAVAVAAKLNKPLFIQVITDGGVYGNSERRWLGDSPTRSMTLIGYYNPKGNTQVIRSQVGHYDKNGEVNKESLVGSNLENVQLGVLANYLNVQGKLSQLGKIIVGSDGTASAKKIDQLLMFA